MIMRDLISLEYSDAKYMLLKKYFYNKNIHYREIKK